MKIRRFEINGHECGTIGLADWFLLRLRGMLGRDFRQFDALLLCPCAEIHTLFMAYPIDAVFINKTGQVVMIAENLSPWVPCKGTRSAHSVIELPAGKAREWEIRAGDQIAVR